MLEADVDDMPLRVGHLSHEPELQTVRRLRAWQMLESLPGRMWVYGL